MDDIIMRKKSKGTHREIIIIIMRVWHAYSAHIQYLNNKFNSYNQTTSGKWNKRATMYNHITQDDILGNKANKISLFKMSAISMACQCYWETLKKKMKLSGEIHQVYDSE